MACADENVLCLTAVWGVPALLHWPGHADPGRVVEMPCSTLDYFPTIAETMQFEMPDNRPIDGISLLPTIEGNMTERPTPIPYRFNSGKDAMFSRTDPRYDG